MVIMSRMPILILDGFSILLGITVGFVLVSLYHPLFLIFTLVIIALIWVVWLIWGARANPAAAIDMSHAKHGSAVWLEQIGESNGFLQIAAARRFRHRPGPTGIPITT